MVSKMKPFVICIFLLILDVFDDMFPNKEYQFVLISNIEFNFRLARMKWEHCILHIPILFYYGSLKNKYIIGILLPNIYLYSFRPREEKQKERNAPCEVYCECRFVSVNIRFFVYGKSITGVM